MATIIPKTMDINGTKKSTTTTTTNEDNPKTVKQTHTNKGKHDQMSPNTISFPKRTDTL